MPRKTSSIVVRPVQRGATVASKTVLGTMHELNRHAPLAEIAPHLVMEDPKPWKQPRPGVSRSAPRRGRGRANVGTGASHGASTSSGGRNAGRGDGWTTRTTWLSRRYLSGHAVGAPDAECEWELNLSAYPEDPYYFWEMDYGLDVSEYCPPTGPVEVGILDIAKPARPRGTAREYEMVQSVGRVLALADDDQWDLVEAGDGVDGEWETIAESGSKEKDHGMQKTYAAVLQA